MLLLALALAGEPVEVTWTAPDRCPPSSVVRDAVAANLAREDFGDALASVRVEASAQEDPAGWRLHVEVRLPDGMVERELTATTCEELAAAAGLIIAVALDPLRVDQVRPPPEPKPLPEAWVNPAKPDTPVPEPEPTPRPAAEPTLRFDLRAAGMLDVGTLPSVRGGAAVGFGLVGTWLRADATLLYWAPRDVLPFNDTPGVGARLQQGGAGARVCLKPELGAWEPSTCGGMEAGLAWGRGVGLENPRTTLLPWLTATAGLEVAWVSRSHVGLFAGVDAQFHAIRPRVRLDGLGEALRVAPVGARALLGVLFRVPR